MDLDVEMLPGVVHFLRCVLWERKLCRQSIIKLSYCFVIYILITGMGVPKRKRPLHLKVSCRHGPSCLKDQWGRNIRSFVRCCLPADASANKWKKQGSFECSSASEKKLPVASSPHCWALAKQRRRGQIPWRRRSAWSWQRDMKRILKVYT